MLIPVFTPLSITGTGAQRAGKVVIGIVIGNAGNPVRSPARNPGNDTARNLTSGQVVETVNVIL